MEVNKEQLLEIFNKQEELDRDIFEKHGLTEYPKNNMNIALFVELGELMNELPTKFKHWKSSAVDNKEKALEEYVDCIHFMTSITINHCKEKKLNYENVIKKIILKKELPYMGKYNYATLLYEVSHIGYIATYRYASLLLLGEQLGFSWDEIYKAYLKKNQINHERQDNNY